MRKIMTWSLSRIFGGLLCLVLVLAAVPYKAAAAPGGNDPQYTYTVTLYAGNQGSFSGAEGVSVTGTGQVSYVSASEIRITGLSYGDRINVAPQSGMVTLNEDSKYYVRGIRESGKDNNTVGNPSFMVDSDREYVIAYGIRGNMVSYQVNYQDAEGNTLAESQTFYGVVGDRPVVAFQYIDGYQPQAYNLTGTLSSNEAANIFTFIYRPIPVISDTGEDDGTDDDQDDSTQTGETQTGGQTGETQPGGQTTGDQTAGGQTPGAGTAGNDGTVTGDGDASGGDDAAAGEGGTADAGEDAAGEDGTVDEDGAGEAGQGDALQEPEELMEIQDESTPLAEAIPDGSSDASQGRPAGTLIRFAVIAGAAAAVLAVLAGVLIFWFKKRKAGDR